MKSIELVATAIACMFGVSFSMAEDAPHTAQKITDPRALAALKELQGQWKVVSLERRGRVQDAAIQKDLGVVINDDQIALTQSKRPKPSFRIAALDPGKTPHTIDFMGPQGKVLGIFAVENGKLTLSINYDAGPNATRPSEFKTQLGDNKTDLFTLERVTAMAEIPGFWTWTWKEDGQQRQAEAQYVDNDKTAVRLKKPSGETISIPIKQLDFADMIWLTNMKPVARLNELQGQWKVVAMETAGKAWNENGLGITVKGDQMVFTKNGRLHDSGRITTVSGGETFWNINLFMNGNYVHGIYVQENDKLRLCLPSDFKPNMGRPAALKTRKGDNLVVISAKRVAAGDAPATAAPAKTADPKLLASLKDLQGQWKAVRFEIDGGVSNNPGKFGAVIKDDEFALTQGGRNAGSGRITVINSGVSPHTIDLITSQGVLVQGLYAFDKGQFTLCLPSPDTPTKVRPAEFKTQKGDGLTLLVMERSAATAQLPTLRTWTDNTGTHHMEADFLGLDNGIARLKKVNGVILSVPLDRLSEADRQYVSKKNASPTAAKSPDGGRPAPVANKSLAEACFHEGEDLARTGHGDRAIAMFRKALEAKSDYAEAHVGLGKLIAAQGRHPEAIACFHKALEIKPEYIEARLNLGDMLAFTGRFDEAIGQFREALRIKPDCAEAHNNLGKVLVCQGRLDEAIGQFREALRLKPDYDKAARNLAAAEAQKARAKK